MMNDKQKYVLQQAIYIVVICFVFFLMFLGILRTFEINDYFGIEQYKYVKLYCEPKGFFGWGYDCDVIQYNKDIGNVPQDYNEYPIYNITFNETMSAAT